jgi:hypothetical protein
MITSLSHLSMFEDDDLIGLANGLETMCYDDDGSVFE